MLPIFQFALQNLLARSLRSFLALLGLTIAIVGMVGLFSVAEGIDQMVNATFSRIPGLLILQPGAPVPLFSKIPSQWVAELRQIDGIHVVNPEIWARVQIIEGKPTFSPPRFFFGTEIESRNRLWYGVYREAIIKGRFLRQQDRGTLNTVVSRQIAEQFHKAVGDTLRIDGNTLNIIGIYHCDSLLLDVAIILDIDQVRAIARIGPESVCAFYVELDHEHNREQIIEQIKTRFRGRTVQAWSPPRFSFLLSDQPPAGSKTGQFFEAVVKVFAAISDLKADSGQDAAVGTKLDESTDTRDPHTNRQTATSVEEDLPLEIRSADDWAKEFKRFSADLDIFLLIMTGIGVTIAVVSILNTMLMSVTERYIEFGILKANGWAKADVLKLITLESAMLGLLGGIFGSSLGWVGTQIINHHWPTRVNLFASPQLLAFSIIFSTALGIAGGLYPAFLAARMMPMDAIRRG